MALDLAAIHEALAAQVRAYIADDWNVAAYPMSGMERPLIEVWPGSEYVSPWETMSGTGIVAVGLRLVMTIGGDWETDFLQITRALSIGTDNGTSLVDAVMSDKTLGGLVETMIAARPDSPMTWTPGNADALTTAEVPVVVYVRKEGAKV